MTTNRRFVMGLGGELHDATLMPWSESGDKTVSSQPAIVVKPIAEAQIGEYVELADLIRVGGKFYQMDGKSYYDTPLSSFILDLPGGYRRIE